MDKPIVTEEVKRDLLENFKKLEEPVTLAVLTKEGVNDQYNKIATQLITEIAAVDKRLSVEFHSIGDEYSKKHGVLRSPTILIAPDKYNIRFTGTPLGEEGRSLVMSLILASSRKATVLSPESVNKLGELKEKRHVTVFVSPT